MAIELSTAGASISYAPEATAGTRPTTGFVAIPCVKSIPDINPEPSGLEVTDLSDTEWKRYIPGLKDPGSSIGLTCNNTEELHTAWDTTLMTAYDTAHKAGKALWFCIQIPGLTQAFFFSADPSPLGLGGIDVDSVLEVDAYVTPTKIIGWAAKPTTV